MTNLEQAWLEAYIETGDAKAALREAGSGCSDATLASRASQMKRKLAAEIDQRLRERFGSDAPMFAGVVRQLAQSGKSEDVKLKAAKDWLDRGGYKPVEKHEHLVRHESDIAEDIRRLLASMDPQTLQAAGIGNTLELVMEALPDHTEE